MVTKFCTPPPGSYTGKMLFANASKIITGSEHFDLIFLKLFVIYQSGHKKGYGCNASTRRYIIYLFIDKFIHVFRLPLLN